MKVSLVSWDLSHNCLGRAQLLAEMLGRRHDVEIVGTEFGDGVWPPARSTPVGIRGVPGARWPGYRRPLGELVRMLDGDVIYAVKPRPSSLGAALLARLRRRRPVVLDIDDDERAFAALRRLDSPRRLLRDVREPNGVLWTRVAVRLRGRVDGLTVASRALQRQHGGAWIPHAKDTARLRPRPERADEARRELGVEGRRVIMFFGTPRAYKGIQDAAEAVARMREDALLVVVGVGEETPLVRRLRAAERVRLHGVVDAARLPLLLEAADVVTVPSRAEPGTAYQVPSKLFDAMALAKPIVATDVSDQAWVLGDGRGIVVPSGDVAALAAAYERVLAAPREAAAMGGRARAWCERHASYDAVAPALAAVVERAAGAVAA